MEVDPDLHFCDILIPGRAAVLLVDPAATPLASLAPLLASLARFSRPHGDAFVLLTEGNDARGADLEEYQAQVVLEHGLRVQLVRGLAHAIRVVAAIARIAPGKDTRVFEAGAFQPRPSHLDLLEVLPGLTRTRAKALLRSMKSIKRIASATRDELAQAIGQEKRAEAANLHAFLHKQQQK